MIWSDFQVSNDETYEDSDSDDVFEDSFMNTKFIHGCFYLYIVFYS